jgi:hypothetical protein
MLHFEIEPGKLFICGTHTLVGLQALLYTPNMAVDIDIEILQRVHGFRRRAVDFFVTVSGSSASRTMLEQYSEVSRDITQAVGTF